MCYVITSNPTIFYLYHGNRNNPDSPDIAGAALKDALAQVYQNITPTFQLPCRGSLSRNFQRLL